MDNAAYPGNWPAIARRVKEAARWHCQQCGKQCYHPGETCIDRRKVLTVHHVNHLPHDCRESNLIALCAPCHLRADAKHHARNARRTRAKKTGQMFLPKLEYFGG